jgi:hypothetical protein
MNRELKVVPRRCGHDLLQRFGRARLRKFYEPYVHTGRSSRADALARLHAKLASCGVRSGTLYARMIKFPDSPNRIVEYVHVSVA